MTKTHRAKTEFKEEVEKFQQLSLLVG